MHKANLSCSAIIAEVKAALRVPAAPQLSPASIDHMSECPRCRAGLLLLIKVSAAAGAQTPACCVGDQAQLAAFLELERADPAQAAATYPAVWQHIWSCASCLEDYLLAHALLLAEEAGAFPPLRLPAPPPTPQPGLAPLHFVLTRRLLQMALPPRHAAAARRGGAGGHVLFADTIHGSRQITMTAYEQDAERWNMEVTCAPAIAGNLFLAAGPERFAAPFQPSGVALIRQLPASLFSDPDAPAFEISIVPV